MFEYLDHAGVRSVSADQLPDLLEEGWVLVDVRPCVKKPYAVAGAVNVPIFEVVDMSALGDAPRKTAIRALAHYVNGVTPMALNESFADQVSAAVGDSPVILMCEKGGSLDPGRPVPARSLSAAWKLRTAWDTDGRHAEQKIAHLRGGTATAFSSDVQGNK